MNPGHITIEVMQQAYEWLCHARLNYPADADVWDLRFHWSTERDRILALLNAGHYRFRPLSKIIKSSGEVIAIWSSADALVIKSMALVLARQLPTHPLCTHISGHGGGKASIEKIQSIIHRGQFRFVCRTDIRQYYSNINKSLLFAQLESVVDDPVMLGLLHQFLHYSVEFGGVFTPSTQGIARGSALSPLLAAFHLFIVDSTFAHDANLQYMRFMDDFLIFARTRWQLRRAVRRLNLFFNEFGFEQHPDKTFIGRIEKGFDWMGYVFNARGDVCVSPRAWKYHLVKLCQLYEQTRYLSLDMRWRRVVEHRLKWKNSWGLGQLYGHTSRLFVSADIHDKCQRVVWGSYR